MVTLEFGIVLAGVLQNGDLSSSAHTGVDLSKILGGQTKTLGGKRL